MTGYDKLTPRSQEILGVVGIGPTPGADIHFVQVYVHLFRVSIKYVTYRMYTLQITLVIT